MKIRLLGVDNTSVFLATAEQSTKAVLFQRFPPNSRLKDGQDLGGDTFGAADPN